MALYSMVSERPIYGERKANSNLHWYFVREELLDRSSALSTFPFTRRPRSPAMLPSSTVVLYIQSLIALMIVTYKEGMVVVGLALPTCFCRYLPYSTCTVPYPVLDATLCRLCLRLRLRLRLRTPTSRTDRQHKQNGGKANTRLRLTKQAPKPV
jgi:hypothetical protein